VLTEFEEEMQQAAAMQSYERAARLRDILQSARIVSGEQRLLYAAIEQNNNIILYLSAQVNHTHVFYSPWSFNPRSRYL
jgi:DNA polymerase-3 subunit epsilon